MRSNHQVTAKKKQYMPSLAGHQTYQFKLSTLATAATKGPALWMKIATSGISYTKQKSRHCTQSKLTLVFVTHHSNRVTETTLAPLEMNVIEIPLS